MAPVVRTLAVNVIDPATGYCGPAELQYDDRGVIHQRVPLPAGRDLPWAVPAGIDVHTHILSEGVYLARVMSGPQVVPPLSEVGALYQRVGYTTAIDAAVLPEDAPRVCQWASQLDGLDVGFLVLATHHPMVVREIQRKSQHGLTMVLADLVAETGAIGVKIVNPSGANRQPLASLEEPGPYGFSPAEHIVRMAEAIQDLKLAHPLHIHGLDLGVAGNVTTTLAMLRILEGISIHLAHLQFHCYAQAADGGLASGSELVAQWINEHPEVSCDIGQVVFKDTVTLSNDLLLQERLKTRHGNRWAAIEGSDGGLAAVPYGYQPDQLANAVQWAVGLELALMIDNPWQVFMSTDHPNGGGFWQYPLIESWLMNGEARQTLYRQLPKAVRDRVRLGTLDRVYSDEEMTVFTSAGPARRLGLQQKGNLGPGALMDLVIYSHRETSLAWGEPLAVMRRGAWVFHREGKAVPSGPSPARLWRALGMKVVEEDGCGA